MNTQQNHERDLKRVLYFPCKLNLQKLALVRRLTANGSKGTATARNAYSRLILAEEDMKRREEEMNALRLTNTIKHITVFPAYHFFNSRGGEPWKAHTKS